AGVGRDRAGEHLHQGGLAGAVVPDEADDLAGGDPEVDPPEDVQDAVAFPDVDHLDARWRLDLGLSEGRGHGVNLRVGCGWSARVVDQLKISRYSSTLSAVTMVIGTSMKPFGSAPSRMALSSWTASTPSWRGSCWMTASTRPLSIPPMTSLVRSQPMILVSAAGSSAATAPTVAGSPVV